MGRSSFIKIAAFRRDPKPPSRLRADVPTWLDHCVLKAVARDKQLRFETAKSTMLPPQHGASRPLPPEPASPLVALDPTALWKIAVTVSLTANVLLLYWLLFLPRRAPFFPKPFF